MLGIKEGPAMDKSIQARHHAPRPTGSFLRPFYRSSYGRIYCNGSALLIVASLFAIPAAVRQCAAKPRPRPAAGGKYLVYVGTYTDKGSKGIYAYRFDSSNGEIEPIGLAAAADQPSYLAADPSHKFLYAVNEVNSYQGNPTGTVSAFSIDQKTGMLAPLNQLPSRGSRPAHIAVDHTGKYVMVANYLGGSVAVFPIQPNGQLGDATSFVQHRGSSVNKTRQTGPHAHEVVFSPDNRFALVPDLGLDELLAYPFDAAKGLLGDTPIINQTTPGFGPRHMVFSPNGQFIYLLSELSSTISVIGYDPQSGHMSSREVVRIAPREAEQKSGAEVQIDPSGKFLYASNRGTNLLVVYSIAADTGYLTTYETITLPAKTPRQFTLDPSGRWLWDANQDSDDILLYNIDAATGGLTPSGLTLKVASPTCVTFVPIS
jgi:6-phosphogluconolactonase